MKRWIALLLCAVTLISVLSGCAGYNKTEPSILTEATVETQPVNGSTEPKELRIPTQTLPNFTGLSDPKLLPYVEEAVYTQLVETLDSDAFFVENVQATYISKEYLQELSYNSQSNIYFGYTIAELDQMLEGDRYVFTLGEDGQTVVKRMEVLTDDTYDKVLKNIVIGTGVILVCVTISVISGGVGAPAVCAIFAASAKTGSTMALSLGTISALSSGIVKGYETGDLDEALKAAALTGSEGFKFGAISGAIGGGVKEAYALHGATLNGLTMNQAAQIQRESNLPLAVIKSFHSMDEYQIYKEANLVKMSVNGKWALTQKINWDFVGDLEDGRTNAQRVWDGLAPLDPTGQPYELHHIGQMTDSPLAVLTHAQHHGNYGDLHFKLENSEVDHGYQWTKQRIKFWKDLLEASMKG